jgi:uncharacterized protein (DUF1697 family)
MTRYVALFRGINVGKAKRIAMAELRALLESLGYGRVQTLLNSGNTVFDGAAMPASNHALRIQAAVLAQLGVDALVIVKSERDISAVLNGNTLQPLNTDPSRMLIAFTHDQQSLTALQSMASHAWAEDALHVGEYAAYAWCAKGILESALAVALLKNLAHTGTTRNIATVEKIHALMQAKPK